MVLTIGVRLVPKEITDLLYDLVSEVKNEVRDMRNDMRQEHEKLEKEVINLGKEVNTLQHQEKITRWIFCGIGALLTLAVRELIPKII